MRSIVGSPGTALLMESWARWPLIVTTLGVPSTAIVISSPEWLGATRRTSTDAFLDLDTIVSIRAEEYIVPLE